VPLSAKDLFFRAPHSLTDSQGAAWDFQKPEASTYALVASSLHLHYGSWKSGLSSKAEHAMFFCLSGPGTGKSRMLDEFPSICRSAAESVSKRLHTVLLNAVVINVSFENGSSTATADLNYAIGARMLYQLRPKTYESMTWDLFRNDPVSQVTAEQVVNLMLEAKSKQLSIIICVDGLHKLEHVPGSKTSPFYSRLDELAALVNVGSSRPFVVVCVAATVNTPVKEWLGSSQQTQHTLPVTRLQPPTINQRPVFQTDGNRLLQLLVDDMDGHGRPLEVLSQALAAFKSFDPTIGVHFSKLMADVLFRLKQRYERWTDANLPVLHAVLCQTAFQDVLDVIPGTNLTVDQVVSSGLFRVVTTRTTVTKMYLRAPYIWVALMCGSWENPLLLSLQFDCLVDQGHLSGASSAVAPTSWASFEHFCASFRAFKAAIIPPPASAVKWSDFHSGAIFGSGCDVGVVWKPLQFVQASAQFETSSTSWPANIAVNDVDFPSVQLIDGEHVVLCARSNPGGDAVMGITLTDESKTTVAEVQQYKHGNQRINQRLFSLERQKAVNLDRDFFVLVSTGDSDRSLSVLPPRSALVDSSNFERYFGPFAGRAYFLMKGGPPSVNFCTSKQLATVPGITSDTAGLIICLVKEKGPFSSSSELITAIETSGATPQRLSNAAKTALQKHVWYALKPVASSASHAASSVAGAGSAVAHPHSAVRKRASSAAAAAESGALPIKKPRFEESALLGGANSSASLGSRLMETRQSVSVAGLRRRQRSPEAAQAVSSSNKRVKSPASINSSKPSFKPTKRKRGTQ